MTGHRVLPCVMLALCGCASLTSTPLSTARPVEGLTYFMPRRDLLITLTVHDTCKHEAAFAVTPAYPDLEKGYVLHHVSNGISKTTSTVGVGTNGLLSTTKSTTVSGVTDLAKSVGEMAGAVSALFVQGFRVDATTPAPVKCTPGAHVFRFDLRTDGTIEVCGDTVEITKLSARAAEAPAPAPAGARGLFYRQAEPYHVRVRGGGRLNAASIVLSPSNAPVRYLPIHRSFAAGNTTDVEFTDGMPTSVKQDIDGEVVAIIKLPAVVLTSYFTAVGTFFSSFKTRDTSEAAMRAGAIQLEMAKRKYDACLAAIRRGDTASQTALGCGQ